jgi:hypothetical protein
MLQQSKIKSTKDKDKEIEKTNDSNKLKNNKKQIKLQKNKVSQLLLHRILNLKYQVLCILVNQQYQETLII